MSQTTSYSERNLATRFWMVIVIVAVAAAGLAHVSHGSTIEVPRRTFEGFPTQIAQYESVEIPVEKGVQEVLGATDLLNRAYLGNSPADSVGLFIGYFSNQRRGGAIHSPKNCLPGAGWTAVRGDIIPVDVPGRAEPMRINRYIVQKDNAQQVILYWYHSQGRVIGSEYDAKFFLIWDAMTRNRSDGALVRVISAVGEGTEEAALEKAKAFVREIYPHLNEFIPS